MERRVNSITGSGFAGPLNLDVGGGLRLIDGEQAVLQSVRLILATRPGERVMRPDFGCRIHDFVFAPNNPATHRQVRQAVEAALSAFEPRIEEVKVEVMPDAKHLDRLLVRVRYQICRTHVQQNLVYPFYLQQG